MVQEGLIPVRQAQDEPVLRWRVANRLAGCCALVVFSFCPLLGLRDAEPGVVHIDPQPAVAQAAADQHAPLVGVLDGIGHQVLQQAAEQPAVRAHRAPWRTLTYLNRDTRFTSGRGPRLRGSQRGHARGVR